MAKRFLQYVQHHQSFAIFLGFLQMIKLLTLYFHWLLLFYLTRDFLYITFGRHLPPFLELLWELPLRASSYFDFHLILLQVICYTYFDFSGFQFYCKCYSFQQVFFTQCSFCTSSPCSRLSISQTSTGSIKNFEILRVWLINKLVLKVKKDIICW